VCNRNKTESPCCSRMRASCDIRKLDLTKISSASNLAAADATLYLALCCNCTCHMYLVCLVHSCSAFELHHCTPIWTASFSRLMYRCGCCDTSCQAVLQSSTKQWEMHCAQANLAVHLCCISAHPYEGPIFISVFSKTQPCCQLVLRSSTE